MSDRSLAGRPAATPRSEPAIAILLLVAAVGTFSLMDSVTKLLTAQHHGIQVTWGRFFFTFLPMAIAAGRPHRFRRLLQTSQPVLQILRATFLVLSGLSFIGALSFMELGQTTAISFVGPLMVVALSAPLLGERIGLHRWLSVAAGFGGMLMIVWPGGAGTLDAGVLLPVAAAAFWAFGLVLTRRMRQEDPLTMLFYMALVGAVLMSVLTPFFWTPPSPESWLKMLIAGLLNGLANFLLIAAFLRGDASALAPFNYAQLIWASLFGWLIFREVPTRQALAGAAVIILAGLYAWHRERLAARRKPA